MKLMHKDLIVATGEYISEWLEDHQMSQAELALRMGVSPKHVSKLVSGEAALTHSVAHSLSFATGVPASVWMAYENTYRAELAAHERQASFLNQLGVLDIFPLDYFEKWGLITESQRTSPVLVKQLMQVFEVCDLTSIEGLRKYREMPRPSTVSRQDLFHLHSWLRVGELQAGIDASSEPFSAAGLEQVIPELVSLVSLSSEGGFVQAIELLRTIGVYVCLTPQMPGIDIRVATHWVLGRPVIQLVTEWASEMELWFVLLGELGQVLQMKKPVTHISGLNPAEDKQPEAFARNLLADVNWQDAAQKPVCFSNPVPQIRSIA